MPSPQCYRSITWLIQSFPRGLCYQEFWCIRNSDCRYTPEVTLRDVSNIYTVIINVRTEVAFESFTITFITLSKLTDDALWSAGGKRPTKDGQRFPRVRHTEQRKIVQKKQCRLWVETLQHDPLMTRGHCCTTAVRDPPWSQTLRGLRSITQPAVNIQQRAGLSAVMRSEMMDTCSEVYLSVMYSWSNPGHWQRHRWKHLIH